MFDMNTTIRIKFPDGTFRECELDDGLQIYLDSGEMVTVGFCMPPGEIFKARKGSAIEAVGEMIMLSKRVKDGEQSPFQEGYLRGIKESLIILTKGFF